MNRKDCYGREPAVHNHILDRLFWGLSMHSQLSTIVRLINDNYGWLYADHGCSLPSGIAIAISNAVIETKLLSQRNNPVF